MLFIPFYKTEILSPFSLDEAVARLSLAVDEKRKWYHWPHSDKDYRGRVSREGFALIRITMWRIAYQPVIRGRFKPDENGTRVIVKVVPQPIAIAAMILVFGVGGVMEGARHGLRVMLNIVFFFMLFHSVMYVLGFLPEKNAAVRMLRETLCA
jgi:hypothetical protein